MIHFRHARSQSSNIKFHLHNGCEIYFPISGVVHYLVDKTVYTAGHGDLFFTNELEMHTPYVSTGPDTVYERIYCQFGPEDVQPYNSPSFDLLNCFYNRPKGRQNKISLNPEQLQEVGALLHKIKSVAELETDGGPILKQTYFIELLVVINRAFLGIRPAAAPSGIHPKLAPIMDYIDSHLAHHLSLEAIEKKFYISKFYLSRLFKQQIGVGIQEYVKFKRISKAKELLSQGFNVTEACQSSGFNDYSHFIRTFKSIVGVSPGQYMKNSRG